MPDNTENVLRSALAARAGQITAAPSSLAEAAVEQAGEPWRPGSAGVVAAAAASVAAIVVAATAVLTGSGGTSPAAPASPPAATSSPASPTLAYEPGFEPYPFPPRGDLTGDPTLEQQLVSRPWGSGGYFGPAVETRQLVFAGTVDGGGMQSLVIGRDGNQWLGWWTAGTAVTNLQVMGDAQPVDITQPIVWSNSVEGVGALVVIASPGDDVSVSAPELDADGTTNQEWTSLPVTDGVASLSLNGAQGAGAAQVRVTREGSVVYEGGVQGGAANGEVPPGPNGGGGLSSAAAAMQGARGNPDQVVVYQALAAIAEPLGISDQQIAGRVVWGGVVQDGGQVVALVATAPSGARVATVQVMWPEELEGSSTMGTGGTCATAVYAANVDPAAMVLTAQCNRYDLQGALISGVQIIVPPAGTRTVRLLDAEGNELQRESILDGSVWSGPVVDGLASVGALDSSGALVTSNPVMVDTDLYDQ